MNSLFFRIKPRWRQSEQIRILRALSIYLHAGLPLARALDRTQQQSRDKNTKHILTKTRDAVLSGKMLSGALLEHAGKMNPLIHPLLCVGEYSGSLAECLMDLSLSLTEQRKLRARITGAALYPAIIATGTLCVSVFLLLYVFPAVLPILSGLQAELPPTTRSLIFLSKTLGSIWVWVGILVFFSLVAIVHVHISKRPRIRAYRDALTLSVPLFGNTLRNYYLTQIAYILSLLLSRGIPVGEAFSLTAKTTQNQAFSETLMNTSKRVEQGEFLASCLSDNTSLFPTTFTDILSTGEETGTAIESFKLLYAQYREDFERQNEQLLTLLEPVLMLFMGLIVGYIALAILMPVYQISHVMQ